jgi:hypothetical protein
MDQLPNAARVTGKSTSGVDLHGERNLSMTQDLHGDLACTSTETSDPQDQGEHVKCGVGSLGTTRPRQGEITCWKLGARSARAARLKYQAARTRAQISSLLKKHYRHPDLHLRRTVNSGRLPFGHPLGP